MRRFWSFPFNNKHGWHGYPIPFTQAIIVTLVRLDEVRPTTFPATLGAITLTGTCSNCLPVSSQFQTTAGLSVISNLSTGCLNQHITSIFNF
jgi:hypothetical protein